MVFFFIIEKYCYNGVFFINDIISEDKQSYQELQNKYMISTNFLEYYGIVGAVLGAFIYCMLKPQFSKIFTNENPILFV
jgi:hypothetical protein